MSGFLVQFVLSGFLWSRSCHSPSMLDSHRVLDVGDLHVTVTRFGCQIIKTGFYLMLKYHIKLQNYFNKKLKQISYNSPTTLSFFLQKELLVQLPSHCWSTSVLGKHSLQHCFLLHWMIFSTSSNSHKKLISTAFCTCYHQATHVQQAY